MCCGVTPSGTPADLAGNKRMASTMSLLDMRRASNRALSGLHGGLLSGVRDGCLARKEWSVSAEFIAGRSSEQTSWMAGLKLPSSSLLVTAFTRWRDNSDYVIARRLLGVHC